MLNHRLDLDEILQENTRHIKIYCGKLSSQMEFGNIYFRWSKLVNESYQICQTRHSCTVWDISGSTGGSLLRFKLC